MSDTGTSQWDIFYLQNFSLTTSPQVVSMTSTIINGESNQLGSGGGSEDLTDTTSNSAVLTPGDTLNDGTFDGSVTYIGQGTITVDNNSSPTGTSTATAIFGEADIGGTHVVIMYVPNVNGGMSEFTSSSDFITKNPTVTISQTDFTLPCFVAGTMIATPDGERPVEALRSGDLVLTAEGAAKPVRWLGRSTHSALFINPERSQPVRIKAGALGENLPVRDLLVSPGHAMLLDGMLVQAGAVVNGTSIVRETMKRSVTYYHIETNGHDVLLAEGCPTESFLMGVEEMKFDNLAERPEGAMPAELDYPRVKAPRQLPRSLRELLESRAAAIMPDIAAAA
jgi:hypothetical protein